MTEATPRWQMLAFVACCIYSAAAIATSWINTAHNSDTVLQSFISIHKWTPYYWEENRFGMLVPALAAPIRAWGWNLLVQMFLIAGSGLGCLYLTARLTGSTRLQAQSGTPLIFAVVLLIFRPGAALVLLLSSTYLPPLFLMLAALRVWTDQGTARLPLRVAGFVFLLLLSLWINTANVIVVGIAVI
ncbi:MAG: hypothetical protein H7Y20_01670, partial [Bryobacteraceae bacterium]|nr:hypothetical protein [Bryobacteraceae bacterium]